MRVLLVGRSRERDIEQRIRHALLRAGHEATLVDERRPRYAFGPWLGNEVGGAWLRARFAAFDPEFMILGKPIGIPARVLADLCMRVPSVMWYRDLRVPPDPDIVARARHVDTLFLTAGGQASLFEAAGVRRALYLPDGVDPELDRPLEPTPEFECDVAYLGSGDPYRAAFLEKVARRFHLKTFGRRWEPWAEQVGWTGREAHHDDFGRVCASARIVLGVERGFHREALVAGYSSNRMWRVVVAGGFYLGYGAPGVRDLLRDGEHCVFYDDDQQALDLIAHYLAHDDARERIRAAGRRFVLEHHTLDARLHNLLTMSPFVNPLAAAES